MHQVLRIAVTAALLQSALIVPAHADTKSDQQRMLSSSSPALKANKKLVYDFWREVLEGGHLDLANKYLAPGYIQHNPNVPTGRDGFVAFFSKFAKPHPTAPTIEQPLINIVAEGDIVVLSFADTKPDPANEGKTYTTTWFDMFRVQNGMIAEHWDPAQKKAEQGGKTAQAVPKDPMHFDDAARQEYAGKYAVKMDHMPVDFAIVLTEKDDHLNLDVAGTGVGSSGAESLVAKAGDDLYQLTSGDTVQFARTSDGKVFKVTLNSTGQTFVGVKAAK
jgi:predicted SnoaL-like aldol condensation-catalyzing enzyme